MGEYLDLSLASFVLTVLRAVVALALLWGLLRVFDRSLGFSFSNWLTRVSGGNGGGDEKNNNEDENPRAVAMYLGARFVGACILFGLLFS
jgi:hypothetical protein